MNFETQSNNYLQELQNNNIIIDGNIIGVNEILKTSNAICKFMDNQDSVTEKHIIIYLDDNKELIWKFLNPLKDTNDLNFHPGSWKYPKYLKRIIAPKELVMEDMGIKMLGWFIINDFPVYKEENMVHLYCNIILEEHNIIIENLEGVITVEDKPQNDI